MTMAHWTVPGTAVQVRSFPGQTRQVRVARQFAGQALAGCPARDRLLTCVSELAANAIEHTESGAGGEFSVAAGCLREGVAFVAVMDAGGPGKPAIGEVDGAAESGRGLALVAAYSSRWGYRDTARGRHQGLGQHGARKAGEKAHVSWWSRCDDGASDTVLSWLPPARLG